MADFLVAEGVVGDISHERLRLLLCEEGVSFQALKTFKQSNDPDFEAKKNRRRAHGSLTAGDRGLRPALSRVVGAGSREHGRFAEDLVAVTVAIGLMNPVLYGGSFGTMVRLGYFREGGTASGFI